MKIIAWKPKKTGLLAAALALCLGGYAVAQTSAGAYATDRPLPIYCVDTKQKMCSISFDAAWGDVILRHMRDARSQLTSDVLFFTTRDHEG